MNPQSRVVMQAAALYPVNPIPIKRSKVHRRRSIIREFSINTSTHGIPGIARSESIHNRVFWSIVLLIFTGVMFYFIIEAIRVYFDYPTQTTVTIRSERLQYFPSFTFCNAGGIRYDTFIEPFLNYKNSLNLTDIDGTDLSSSIQLEFLKNSLPIIINRGDSIDRYLYTLDSMLIDCQFAGVSCSINDFISFYSSLYGRCFTFNAKRKNTSLYYSYSNSGIGTLVLRLYLHSHQYVSFVTEGIAMMGMVHDNTQLPLIEKAGMTLAPGFKHRLTYTKKTVYSLPPPYSTCTNEIPLAMKIMFDNYGGADYVYSEDICYILCAQTYIYKQCGCVNPAQWNARSIVLPGTNKFIVAPLCNGSNICFVKAINTFELTPSLRNEYCLYCSQQCLITSFSVQSSFSITPPDWLMSRIKKFVENCSIPLPIDWSSQWREHIKTSYLSLEILSESTLVENYTQTATLGLVDVISNIGGQTGLWIGISFLSLMEFVEMIYRLIRYQIYLIQRSTKKKRYNL